MIHYHLDTSIETLERTECDHLLAANSLGRVAFVDGDVPNILPVNYALFEDTIVFRTAPGHKLSAIPMHHVAFEIDGREGNETAWSVVVQGQAREVTTAVGERYDRLRAADLPTFAPGDKDHWIAIESAGVSGRRLRLGIKAD
jgi:nitroimidazol reductase NimA-like FMN-containing flavoprotein (pyridoxamine 5'-phosphate oxidase superfamily)